MNPEMREIARILGAAQSVAVLSHVRPEGDAIGSSLGAVLTLHALGKEAVGFNADPVPAALAFLPGADALVRTTRIPQPFDCYLVVDASDPDRLGGLLDGVVPGRPILNIDHHPTNNHFGSVSWIDPTAAAAGEMLYLLFRGMGVPLSREAAINFYVAIFTDTGSFRYANTTPRALRIAAELIEAGVEPGNVAELLYEQRDVGELRLLGLLLSRIQISPDGMTAWIEVTDETLREVGVTADTLEGAINYPASIRGVRVALLFRDIIGDGTRVSLRSRGAINVAAVAQTFGGGGHRNAAGCTVAGDLSTVRERVLQEVYRVTAGEDRGGRR